MIHTWGNKVLKNRVACDAWADNVEEFGNLYCFTMLGQSTNNAKCSKQPCCLKKVIKKLCTIHSMLGDW